MRIVLVGSEVERERLRAKLPAGVVIVAETERLSEARQSDADAILIASPVDEPVEALTPRENEVLHFMAGGLSNKSIAAQLGISEATVKFHVGSICGKLGAENRTDAVRIAVRAGLIAL